MKKETGLVFLMISFFLISVISFLFSSPFLSYILFYFKIVIAFIFLLSIIIINTPSPDKKYAYVFLGISLGVLIFQKDLILSILFFMGTIIYYSDKIFKTILISSLLILNFILPVGIEHGEFWFNYFLPFIVAFIIVWTLIYDMEKTNKRTMFGVGTVTFLLFTFLLFGFSKIITISILSGGLGLDFSEMLFKLSLERAILGLSYAILLGTFAVSNGFKVKKLFLFTLLTSLPLILNKGVIIGAYYQNTLYFLRYFEYLINMIFVIILGFFVNIFFKKSNNFE